MSAPFAHLKYRVRGLAMAADSRFFGRIVHVEMPNGKNVAMRFSVKDRPASFQELIDAEIGGYWSEHRPMPGEVHLDVGAQVGSYSLLAASSGATVFCVEPDANNRRFLRRNLSANALEATIIPSGAWNQRARLPWRTNTALSSIRGVGMIPTSYPALDEVQVDRIDAIVAEHKIKRLDVIKMDIEGAEIEAIEGAAETIKRHKPLLLIEAYHIRDGQPTIDRVIHLLVGFGIPSSAIYVTKSGLIVASKY